MDDRRSQKLVEIADSLTDGLSPDWDGVATAIDDPGDLKSLQNLARLVDAFRAQQAATEADRDTPQFVWKHLEVHEEIGRGGFGQVYRAFDPILCRNVALKLRRESENRAHASDRMFIIEARSLARVRHPNVLAVHGADRSEGKVGMWADLVPGRTLADVIEADGVFSSSDAHAIAKKLLLALDAVHDAGLVHGDVKASNVVLQPNGEPVLMDLGAASERGGDVAATPAGSPLYLAPERLHGASPTVASDVYAMGVLLYRMFSGQYPRQADQLDQLMDNHRRGKPVSLRSLPAPYQHLIGSMLSEEAEQRPTVNASLAALNEIEMRPERRRRQWVIAAIVGSLVVGLTATTFGFIEARRSAQEARLAQRDAEDVTRFMADLLHAPSGHARGGETTVADLLDDAVTQLALFPPENPLRAARFRNSLAMTYGALGEHERAVSMLQESLATLEAERAGSNERIRTLIALGRSLSLSSEPEAGLQQLDKALGLAEQSEPPSDRLLAEIQLRRGEAYKNIEGPQAGRAIIENALDHIQRVDGPDAVSTQGIIELALADVLIAVGEFATAEELARSAYARLQTVHSDRHINLIAARDTLGLLLSEQGRYQEAYPLVALNAKVLEEQMPEGSHRLGIAYANLSSLLDKMGREEEAMDANQKALGVLESTLGPQHINTLLVLGNHALRLWNLGRVEEAESAYRLSIRRSSETLGPEHPSVLVSRANLAELLLEAGRLQEAESLSVDTIAIEVRVLGDSHPATLFTRFILGASLARSNQLVPAIDVLERTYEDAAEQLGTDHDITVDGSAYLAEALWLAGEAPRAEALLRHVLAVRTERLGAEAKKTVAAAALLAQINSGDGEHSSYP